MATEANWKGGKSERRGNVELRTNEDNSLDEIVIYDKDGRVIFHLEQMDEQLYWMRAGYGEEGNDLVAHIKATIGTITDYDAIPSPVKELPDPLPIKENQPKLEGTWEWE